jgi:PilZ domain
LQCLLVLVFAGVLPALLGFCWGIVRLIWRWHSAFGPSDAVDRVPRSYRCVRKADPLNQPKLKQERRQWPRLPIAIPIFVRSRDDKGKDFLEFATAMNVSAGGALVAVRRPLPHSTQVSLEIPTAPFLAADARPQVSKNLRARSVRVIHAEGYQLVGLKFAKPLTNHIAKPSAKRRKVATTM